RVAMQALLMRATALEFVSRNQAQYLWKQISARRLRLREPPELDFPPEKPTVVETMLRVHRDALGYSNADLAHLLHFRELELSQFYVTAGPDKRLRIAVLK